MSDIECPVCTEHIISPYGLPCGHTLCAACFSRLTGNNCPVCRGSFHHKDKFEPNLLLEKFLIEKNAEYLDLKKKQENYIKINKFTSLYAYSERFHNLKKALKLYIKEHSYYVSLSTLIDEFCLSNNICETELRYIIDQIYSFAAVELDKTWYIINCTSWEYLRTFVDDKKELLINNTDIFYHLISINSDDSLLDLMRLCGLNSKIYTKHKLSKPDSESYITWVLSHKDTDLPKYVSSNSFYSDDTDDTDDTDDSTDE